MMDRVFSSVGEFPWMMWRWLDVVGTRGVVFVGLVGMVGGRRERPFLVVVVTGVSRGDGFFFLFWASKEVSVTHWGNCWYMYMYLSIYLHVSTYIYLSIYLSTRCSLSMTEPTGHTEMKQIFGSD